MTSTNESPLMAGGVADGLSATDRIIIEANIDHAQRSLRPMAHPSPLNHSGGKGRSAANLMKVVSVPPGGVYLDANCGGCSIPLAFAQAAAESGKVVYFRMRDINSQLINFWCCLRDAPDGLVAEVRRLVEPYWRNPDRMFIDATKILETNRRDFVDDKVLVAAAYYIHSQICHPMAQFKLAAGGRSKDKTGWFLHSYAVRLGQLFRWSAVIQGWDFRVQDFRQTFQEAISLGGRAFLLTDPPYEGTGKSSYGVDFGADDHDQLAALVRLAHDGGVRVMVTLNWSEQNGSRYEGFLRFFRLQDWPSRGSDRKERQGQELVILTYDAPHLEFFRRQMGWLTVDEVRAQRNTNDNAVLESVA
ncbi:DNA adenine methylase [Novispirillum itersonii]|uniref:site-specific DNA-methyltransferase (adenine-specific) n=1 Tax=Novispirillum itersonii TaxID=189 RepID=A0A7W9ZGL1_NOVIT|nr:DNA adenine methylase [Novispirillum itersonii]MBB6210860.1 site-specific DNA-adenine methylase [Novispirillum itersonii]